MTNESKSLSIEILDRIFRYLPQNSLKECQRVCQLWYPRAARQSMNHVIFRNAEEINRFLDCQPRMTNTMKKMKICNDSGILLKDSVNELFMNVPNLQEFELDNDLIPICHLDDIRLPNSLTSITASDHLFDTISDIYKFIKILTKLRGTIQKFNMIILNEHWEAFKNWDMISFFCFVSKTNRT